MKLNLQGNIGMHYWETKRYSKQLGWKCVMNINVKEHGYSADSE